MPYDTQVQAFHTYLVNYTTKNVGIHICSSADEALGDLAC